MLVEDIPFTHRFVADARAGRGYARVNLRWLHRPRQALCFFTIVYAVNVASLSITLSWLYEPRNVVGRAEIAAVVATAAFAIVRAALAYRGGLWTAKARMFPGAVFESGFGAEAMVLRNPFASTRLSYDAVMSIAAIGNWVIVRSKGSPAPVAHPRALFPDDVVARIKVRLVGGRRTRP